MEKSLTAILVGHNESDNLKKYFSSLEEAKKILNIHTIYIDQASNDDSVEVAKGYGAEVYCHEKYGYPEKSKKIAVENYLKDDELCILLDADEELSRDLAEEIAGKTNIKVGNVPLSIEFMGVVVNSVFQYRLFRSKYVKLTDTLHSHIYPLDAHSVTQFESHIVNNDMKNIGREIESVVEKANRYTSKESQLSNSKLVILVKLVIMPMIWFFGWGIKNKNFLRGLPGWIHAILMGYYQFILYAKQYEILLSRDKAGSK